MSRNAKILIDLAVLAAVYGVWLLPKWRPLGRRTFAVYTLMYGCLAGIALFTLMPVLAALPFCFDHPYVPMHMMPFEDVILRRGDYVRQIVLNIVLFIPFGVLLPLCRRLHAFSFSTLLLDKRTSAIAQQQPMYVSLFAFPPSLTSSSSTGSVICPCASSLFLQMSRYLRSICNSLYVISS